MTEQELNELCSRFLGAEGQKCLDLWEEFIFDMDAHDPDLKMVHARIGKHLRKQIIVTLDLTEEEIVSRENR
jgi:hypothetical protein